MLRSLLLLTLASVLAPGARTPARPAPDRPNVLLVLGDDMTWSDCEPYGSTTVRTPNMRRLAEEGVCFDNMSTATAMCTPSRHQLFTGLFPVRSGGYPNRSRVHDGVRSLVHHFEALGYRVGLAGKSHVAPRASFPFEKVCPSFGFEWDRIEAFVARDDEQPWFLVVASQNPHAPWNAGRSKLYDPEAIEVPAHLLDTPETRDALCAYYAEITALDDELGRCLDILERSSGAENTLTIFTSEQGSGFPFGKWTCYEAGLRTAFIARWPGRIEGGRRVSALAQYVDVVPTLLAAAGADPSAVDTGVAAPTDADARGFDGRSFLPWLLGERDGPFREHAFGVQTSRGIFGGPESFPIRSVRDARYKYIRNLEPEATFTQSSGSHGADVFASWVQRHGDDPELGGRVALYRSRPAEELYDLERDPFELENLAGDEALRPVAEGLDGILGAWMLSQSDEGVATEMAALERIGPARARKR